MDFLDELKQINARHKAVAAACQRLLNSLQTEETGEIYLTGWGVLADGRVAVEYGCEDSCESGVDTFSAKQVEAQMDYDALQTLF